MEFILVSDVSNVLRRTKVCLERGVLNCTQKWRELDYRTHNLLHPSGMLWGQNVLWSWFTPMGMYAGSFARKGKEIISKPEKGQGNFGNFINTECS